MRPNNQPTEKKDYSEDGSVELHHIFRTIQGEGPFAGERAIFLRLAGCNLQCPLCDTDYTSMRDRVSPEFILSEIRKLASPESRFLVVISGGEPFRQNIGPLVQLLVEWGYLVQIETNGTIYQPDFPYHLATIVCSPKTGKVADGLIRYIAAFKYVLHADSVGLDGLPLYALDHPANPKLFRPPYDFPGTVYIQPVDEDNARENQRHTNAAILSCQQHGYRLCLQLHKILDLE